MREPLTDDDECDVYVCPYESETGEARATLVVAFNGVEVQRSQNVPRAKLKTAVLALLTEAFDAGAHFAFHTAPGIGWVEEHTDLARMRWLFGKRRKAKR